jgi:hypothetical protein
MALSEAKKISLSNEEMALVYSLFNQPQAGKQLLFDTYGQLSDDRIEEKLVTASHTLLARGAVWFTEDGRVQLSPEVAKMLTPVVQYKNMIQVLLNFGDENGFTVTDYYIGTDGSFSSNEINMGVVHQMICGQVQDLAEVIQNSMRMPETIAVELESAIMNTYPRLKLTDYANLEDRKTSKAIQETLRSYGFDPLVREALAQDVLSPVFRGSASVINISSAIAHPTVVEDTGEGLLWLVGKRSSWIITFPRGDEKAVAAVFPGTYQQARQLLVGMIDRIG